MLFAVEPDFLRTLYLAAYVHFRRGVVSHQHHREPRTHPRQRQRFRLRGNFRADLTRYFVPSRILAAIEPRCELG